MSLHLGLEKEKLTWAEVVLCAVLQEVDGPKVEGVPELVHARQRHLHAPLEGDATLSTCIGLSLVPNLFYWVPHLHMSKHPPAWQVYHFGEQDAR